MWSGVPDGWNESDVRELNYDMTNSSSPHGVPIMGAVSKGVSDFSQTSGFHIEGLSPSKMAKVCEVLRAVRCFYEDHKLEYKGVGSRTKRRVVKDFLRLQNPDVVMFQETKREVCDRRFVGSVWSVRNKEWAILPACGASGGILIIWDSKKMRGEEVSMVNNPSIRKEFWVELSDLFGLTYPSWCVGGDFNESPVCKRLDRFLYSNEWELSFPQSLQEVLPRWTSDHWPIVLDTNPFKWGPTPFRFENMWLQHHNFKESFSSWWREFEGNGWEGHKFMRKLQFVKAKLKDWNKNTFGMLKERKKTISDEIANIDAIEQEGALSSDLAAQRAIRKGELEELILREEIHWKQKAKIKWVKEGDCNSKLFHKVANGRRNKNFIKSWRMKELDRDKAPGPDGFTIAVFQDCWDVIKEDLVRVFAEFHNSGIINQNTNASFIVLLPKKRRLRGVYKRPSTPLKRSGEEGVVFKIDFEKAYDHVNGIS
ncbi:hypothetical protein CK203_102803 [Vitis vinifera]|uniref:Endonuclease/exonuclease/phosphatase domain-containing protein n=1 Tax=Vitis vinifera TaxID=29760 RepID=A0A438D5Y0_VITVI|nr:hypothetical protein CK203_102803 [Vitis vinifera]